MLLKDVHHLLIIYAGGLSEFKTIQWTDHGNQKAVKRHQYGHVSKPLISLFVEQMNVHDLSF